VIIKLCEIFFKKGRLIVKMFGKERMLF